MRLLCGNNIIINWWYLLAFEYPGPSFDARPIIIGGTRVQRANTSFSLGGHSSLLLASPSRVQSEEKEDIYEIRDEDLGFHHEFIWNELNTQHNSIECLCPFSLLHLLISFVHFVMKNKDPQIINTSWVDWGVCEATRYKCAKKSFAHQQMLKQMCLLLLCQCVNFEWKVYGVGTRPQLVIYLLADFSVQSSLFTEWTPTRY